MEMGIIIMLYLCLICLCFVLVNLIDLFICFCCYDFTHGLYEKQNFWLIEGILSHD